jgi:hypothetical protein
VNCFTPHADVFCAILSGMRVYPSKRSPHERSDMRDKPDERSDIRGRLHVASPSIGTAQISATKASGAARTSAANMFGVIRGLDPRIHHLRKTLLQEDGLPGQARQ